LRSQLMEAERRCNAAERRADRAELVGMLPPTSSGLRHPSSSTPRPKGRQWRSPILQPRELHDEHPRPRFRQEIRYRDGGSSTRWVGGSDDEGNGDDLTQDSPGTCRYTFYNDDDYLPPPASQRQTSPQARRGRAGSPFRSAASPLNRLLNPSSSSSGSVREVHNDIEVRVNPRSDVTSGVSVTVVSPRRQSETNEVAEASNT